MSFMKCPYCNNDIDVIEWVPDNCEYNLPDWVGMEKHTVYGHCKTCDKPFSWRIEGEMKFFVSYEGGLKEEEVR